MLIDPEVGEGVNVPCAPVILLMMQGWIQDSPQEGAPTLQERGTSTLIWQIFRKNCMKLRKFWSIGGRGHRRCPPWIRHCYEHRYFWKSCEDYPFMYLASTCMRIEYKYQRSRMRVRKSLQQITTYIQRYGRLFQVEHKLNILLKNLVSITTYVKHFQSHQDRMTSLDESCCGFIMQKIYKQPPKCFLAHLPLQPVSGTTEETLWVPL